LIGRLAGRTETGDMLAHSIEFGIRTRREAVNQVPSNQRPLVYVEIWGEPLMTAGRNSFVSELIAMAGGRAEIAEIRVHFDRHGDAPDCQFCGGIVKTATISFGQAMPEDQMRRGKAEVFAHRARKAGPWARLGRMAYDIARRQTVLLVPGRPSHTWVFDGGSFQLADSSARPAKYVNKSAVSASSPFSRQIATDSRLRSMPTAGIFASRMISRNSPRPQPMSRTLWHPAKLGT